MLGLWLGLLLALDLPQTWAIVLQRQRHR